MSYSAILKEISFRDLGCTTCLGGTCHSCSLPVDDVSAGTCMSFCLICLLNRTSVQVHDCRLLPAQLHMNTVQLYHFVSWLYRNVEVCSASLQRQRSVSSDCNKITSRNMACIHIPNKIVCTVFDLMFWCATTQGLYTNPSK